MSHPAILDPLREAVNRRQTHESLRSIADKTGVDYKRLLAFSRGELPPFDCLDVDRLAAHLGLTLTAGEVQTERRPPKIKAR